MRKNVKANSEERMFFLLRELKQLGLSNKKISLSKIGKRHKVSNNFPLMIKERGLVDAKTFQLKCATDDNNLKYYSRLLIQDDREYQKRMRLQRGATHIPKVHKKVEVINNVVKTPEVIDTKITKENLSCPITKGTLCSLGILRKENHFILSLPDNNTEFANVDFILIKEGDNNRLQLTIIMGTGETKQVSVSWLKESKLYWIKNLQDNSMVISSNQF